MYDLEQYTEYDAVCLKTRTNKIDQMRKNWDNMIYIIQPHGWEILMVFRNRLVNQIVLVLSLAIVQSNPIQSIHRICSYVLF